MYISDFDAHHYIKMVLWYICSLTYLCTLNYSSGTTPGETLMFVVNSDLCISYNSFQVDSSKESEEEVVLVFLKMASFGLVTGLVFFIVLFLQYRT